MRLYPIQVAGMRFQGLQQLTTAIEDALGFPHSFRSPTQSQLAYRSHSIVAKQEQIQVPNSIAPDDEQLKAALSQFLPVNRPTLRTNLNIPAQIRSNVSRKSRAALTDQKTACVFSGSNFATPMKEANGYFQGVVSGGTRLDEHWNIYNDRNCCGLSRKQRAAE